MATGHLATVAVLTVSGILIPRVLGVQAYGRYSSVLAVVAALQAVSTLGLPQVSIRFLSPLWPTERSQALALGSTMWTLRLALTPVLGVVGFLWLGATVAGGQDRWILLALGLLCALRAAQEATRILFLPIGHVGKLTGFEFLYALLRLPVVLGTFLVGGLAGTFAALAMLQAAIWVATTTALRRVFPVHPRWFRWSALRPYLSFAAWSFVDAGSSMLFIHFTIYAVAVYSSVRDAGLVAVAMYLYLLVRGLYGAVHRALQALLSEMEAAGDSSRLRAWSERMMEYGVAVAVCLTGIWVALGPSFLGLLLGSEFLPAQPVVTILLVSLIPYFASLTCHGLLYVRNQARRGSLASLGHAVTGISGLFLVLGNGGDGPTASLIAWVFVVAAALFFVSTYVALGRRAGLWLPLRRSLLLALPVTLAIPAAGWESGLGLRCLALAAFLGVYALEAASLGLLSRRLLSKVVGALRRWQDPAARRLPVDP